MANRVFLAKDGLIHNVHVGDQTGYSIAIMVDQVLELAGQLRTKHQPVLWLVDFTKLGHQDTDARRAASIGLRKIGYDRLAAFGGDPYLRYIVNLVARASGKFDRTRYFATQAEALAFLKAPISTS